MMMMIGSLHRSPRASEMLWLVPREVSPTGTWHMRTLRATHPGTIYDCSAAYDSIAAWVMETIYHYHRLPSNLIRFLLNTDAHQRGKVLTAHGSGADFTKECGLGQGSVLAPLKWKLFLDPLLKKLRTVEAPYTLGTGLNTVDIWATAFADDLTIVGPTHAAYVARMKFANQYLSYFGVELNTTKTTYTYANTSRHYESVHIWNRHTHLSAPTAVAAPTEALRYLGGWFSPSLRSKKGKRMLLAGINSILNVLQYKRLDWREYRYVIQAVVASKALYYLNVTPLTDAELDALDRRIALQFKRTLRMSKSTSSHILYLPEEERGFALPSLRQRRDELLLKQAYRGLNDPGILGRVFRSRLSDFRDATGHTDNPLDSPLSHTAMYDKYWFARIAHILQANNHRISTTTHMSTQSTRAHDYPLHLSLRPHTYTKILPELLRHGLRYIGDVADATGLKMRSHQGRQDPPPWWCTLVRELTVPHTSHLAHPVSPTSNPMFAPTTHKVGDVVFLPKELSTGVPGHLTSAGFATPSEGYFYKVVGHTMDSQDRPCCTLRHLTVLKGKPKMTANHIQDTFQRVTGYTTALTLEKATKTESEVAVDLLTVAYRTQRVSCNITPRHRLWEHWRLTNNTDKFRLVYFITQEHSITTATHHTDGPTVAEALEHHQANMLQALVRSQDGQQLHNTNDENEHAVCSTCTFTGADTRCTVASRCSGWYHARCQPQAHGICAHCGPHILEPPQHVQPLNPHELELLRTHAGTLYTSTDGSVRGAQTEDASSTWGVCIRLSDDVSIQRSGKIAITQGEESSYRVELEALIQMYHLLPAQYRARHACDNEAAVKAHTSIRYHAQKSARKWARVDYRTTLDRLHQAINARGGAGLQVVHTHSHLEHTETQDNDLRVRRDTLALADEAANTAHTQHPTPTDRSNRETFTIHNKHGPLEKNPGASTLHTLHERCRTQLRTLRMEGAMARHTEDAVTVGRRTTLPDYLVLFRTKLILNRLPTRQERHTRKDAHADGTPVAPQCPHCPTEIETHEHALLDCPHNTRRRTPLSI